LDRQVDAFPAYVVVRLASIDDVAVLGAATGELASVHDHIVFNDLTLTMSEHFIAHGVAIHVGFSERNVQTQPFTNAKRAIAEWANECTDSNASKRRLRMV